MVIPGQCADRTLRKVCRIDVNDEIALETNSLSKFTERFSRVAVQVSREFRILPASSDYSIMKRFRRR